MGVASRGAVSRAVAHRTIEEIWYVVSGEGSMWRQLDGREEVVALSPGVSITLPAGTSGTVYVRVVDTDFTQGSSTQDTLYVDQMFIRVGP